MLEFVELTFNIKIQIMQNCVLSEMKIEALGHNLLRNFCHDKENLKIEFLKPAKAILAGFKMFSVESMQ